MNTFISKRFTNLLVEISAVELPVAKRLKKRWVLTFLVRRATTLFYIFTTQRWHKLVRLSLKMHASFLTVLTVFFKTWTHHESSIENQLQSGKPLYI